MLTGVACIDLTASTRTQMQQCTSCSCHVMSISNAAIHLSLEDSSFAPGFHSCSEVHCCGRSQRQNTSHTFGRSQRQNTSHTFGRSQRQKELEADIEEDKQIKARKMKVHHGYAFVGIVGWKPRFTFCSVLSVDPCYAHICSLGEGEPFAGKRGVACKAQCWCRAYWHGFLTRNFHESLWLPSLQR